jgi:hypothetical protein
MSSILPTREERADGFRRWARESIDRGVGYIGVSKALDISKGALQNLLAGGVPQEETLARMESAAPHLGLKPNGIADESGMGTVRSPEMERRLDAIESAHANNPAMRMMERENLAAVYRAEALRVEARAAEIRAVAINGAERASEVRAVALRTAEEGAKERAAGLGSPAAPREAFEYVPPPAAKKGRRGRSGK